MWCQEGCQEGMWCTHFASLRFVGLSGKKRNEACFENKLLRNPIDILIYACALMSYWAGLYGSDMQNKTMDGVKLLLSCANRVLVQQQRPPLLIGPPRSHLEDDDTSTDEA